MQYNRRFRIQRRSSSVKAEVLYSKADTPFGRGRLLASSEGSGGAEPRSVRQPSDGARLPQRRGERNSLRYLRPACCNSRKGR